LRLNQKKKVPFFLKIVKWIKKLFYKNFVRINKRNDLIRYAFVVVKKNQRLNQSEKGLIYYNHLISKVYMIKRKEKYNL